MKDRTITSVAEFISKLPKRDSHNKSLFFFRGQKEDQELLPKLFTENNLENYENEMFMEFSRLFPGEFPYGMTTIQKLVKMRHYGLPTRLLDVTLNPLVALFFACSNTPGKKEAKVYVFRVNRGDVLTYNSDRICILANLAKIENEKKEDLFDYVCKYKCCKQLFNNKAGYLLHCIRQERPSFAAEIEPNDILENFFFLPEYNNKRIINQQGAFILFGGNRKTQQSNNGWISERIKKYTILKNKQKRILRELDKIGINSHVLFPEMESVASYIKEQFIKK